MKPALGRTRLGRAACVLALLGACACSAEQDGSVAKQPGPASSSPAARRPSATGSSSPEPDLGAGPSRAPFSAMVGRIGPGLRERMRFSHRAGCPVPLKDLRHLRLSYVGFDGRVRTGELVVHEDQVGSVVEVFRRLYDARWPIRRMRLVDAYQGDDDRSMAADNTSAYNCRRVAGGRRWSEHAFGRAVDVNPLENPYVTAGSVSPPGGSRFARIDRSSGATVPPGVIRAEDVVVSAFARVGWEWGGDWKSSKDYQHFSRAGR